MASCSWSGMRKPVIARMLLWLVIRLAFELLNYQARDVRIIDLFARTVHDAPTTLDLESKASQRALVRDLRMMVLVGDAVRRMATLVMGDVDDVLHRVIDPEPLNRTGVRVCVLAWVEQTLDILGNSRGLAGSVLGGIGNTRWRDLSHLGISGHC